MFLVSYHSVFSDCVSSAGYTMPWIEHPPDWVLAKIVGRSRESAAGIAVFYAVLLSIRISCFFRCLGIRDTLVFAIGVFQDRQAFQHSTPPVQERKNSIREEI